LVERQPSKLIVVGSIPISRSSGCGRQGDRRRARSRGLDPQAHVAQSAEHLLGKEEVVGSIPIVGSSFFL
jgi:hypothetical protein